MLKIYLDKKPTVKAIQLSEENKEWVIKNIRS